MTELEQMKLEAEIESLKAQAEKARLDAAKTDEERFKTRKHWHDWIEIVKIISALVLGAGGVIVAITGYQLSEVKKEKMDIEIEKTKASLSTLMEQKANAEKQLITINDQVDSLRASLEVAKHAKATDKSAIDNAIVLATNIGQAISVTKDQLLAPNQSNVESGRKSDYLVGLQTLGLSDEKRKQINEALSTKGFGLYELSYSYPVNNPPKWFAQHSTVLFYSKASAKMAKELASTMNKLTGDEFAIQQGAGLGVDPTKRNVILIVHYIKR